MIPALDVIAPLDAVERATIKKCIQGYAKPAAGKLNWIAHKIYLLWNAIKHLFCRSDWQLAEKVLSPKLHNYEALNMSLALMAKIYHLAMPIEKAQNTLESVVTDLQNRSLTFHSNLHVPTSYDHNSTDADLHEGLTRVECSYRQEVFKAFVQHVHKPKTKLRHALQAADKLADEGRHLIMALSHKRINDAAAESQRINDEPEYLGSVLISSITATVNAARTITDKVKARRTAVEEGLKNEERKHTQNIISHFNFTSSLLQVLVVGHGYSLNPGPVAEWPTLSKIREEMQKSPNEDCIIS